MKTEMRKFIMIFGLGLGVFLLALGGCDRPKKEAPVESIAWTCPMHPQIHQKDKGRCPICGMPLVKAEKTTTAIARVESPAVSRDLVVTEEQLRNTNIGKFKVERQNFVKDLRYSGRLVSAREVTFQVYESERGLVKKGLEVVGTLFERPDQEHQGRVSSVENFVEPLSRTIRVTAYLTKGLSDFTTDSGMDLRARVELGRQILVPEEAVLHTGTRDLVFVYVHDNTLEARQVTLGHKNERYYQILSGLQEGETIATGANFLIDSEAKIRGL